MRTPSCFTGVVVASSLSGAPLACSETTPAGFEPSAQPSGSAVLVSLELNSPEGRHTYAGAYTELPSSDLDPSRMLELGDSANVVTANGFVYAWDGEQATYTRYSVDAELRFVEGPRVSFSGFGVTGPALTHFVSPIRAYSLLSDAQALVVWNPSTMELIGDISTEALFDAEYPRVEYGEAVRFGDYVAWPISWTDYDNLRFKPVVGVALAHADDEEQLIVRTDARCGAGWSLFADEAGDLYAVGNAYFGIAHFFGPDAGSYPDDCVVRMLSGTTEFDPKYSRNLEQITGSPAVYNTWALPDRTLFAAVWDPADDPNALESSDDYWNAPLLRTLVRIDDGVSAKVANLPKSAVWSTLDYRLDGELYVLESEGTLADDGSAGDARSTLYRVGRESVEKALESGGEIAGIGRIR